MHVGNLAAKKTYISVSDRANGGYTGLGNTGTPGVPFMLSYT